MVKINSDYPLNPCCSKPSIAGKRMSQKWYVYFYYNLNGKRLQFKEYSGLNNKSDGLAQRKQRAVIMCDLLHQKLQERTFNITTGQFENTAAESDTVAELISEYLVLIQLKVTKETYRNYTTLLTQFRNFVSGQTLRQINKQTVRAFFKNLQVKPQSKRSYRTYLSVFFNWLIETKKAPISNPVLGLKIEPNLPTERHRVYSKEEVKRILSYCDSRNDKILKTVIYMVYGAQIRLSELLRIKIGYFQLNNNKIMMPKGTSKIKTKSRTVLIDEPIKEYLLGLGIKYNDPEISDMYFIGKNKLYSGNQFVGQNPMSKHTIDARFKELKRILGIEINKTLYGFKHTGNVNLIINGAELLELMFKNGHSKISQTETYARQLIEQVPEIKYIRKKRDDLEFK